MTSWNIDIVPLPMRAEDDDEEWDDEEDWDDEEEWDDEDDDG